MAGGEQRPTAADRAALGRQAREQAPRASHGSWEPAPDRRDPVAVLHEQDRGRVQELLALRYGRMLESPFSFYRGAAAIMAADLAATPASGLTVQLCGDTHLSNFGTFSSPERELVFDVADFDETLPGPWEWDVKRLAASVCVAGRDRDFKPRQITAAVLASVASYREAMNAFARRGNLEVWYAHVDVDLVSRLLERGVDVKATRRLERELERARRNTSARALGKLTEIVGGETRFLYKPPLLVPADRLLDAGEREYAERNVRDLLAGYRESLPESRRPLLDGYRYVDVARKVVGVGSVGLRVWMILLHGRDGTDPLLLQAKEATTSVLERHLGAPATASHAERVIAGQQLMQSVSDILLGWHSARGPDGGARGGKRDYYVRQPADGKGAIDTSLLLPSGLTVYARLCGWTLARAHARAGDRIAIAAYLGRGEAFDRAIADFSERYADQNATDLEALRAAVAAGRVQAAGDPKD